MVELADTLALGASAERRAGSNPVPRTISCDSQDLALHSVMSDGVATVRQTLGWGGEGTAQACANAWLQHL